MKQKIYAWEKLLHRGTLNKIFAVLCVALLFVYIVPHALPHARATGSITVSNVAFDPTTGYIAFDYTGDNLTGHIGTIDIDDTTGTTVYWDNGSLGECTSSHCYSTLNIITPDSGVTSVKLHVQVGGTVDDSQTLNYPLPLPTTNTSQAPTVGGWINVGETWTYASADAPTFTFTVSGDETGRYSPGMRIKLTQSSTTKYFFVTAVSYSNPNTTVTIYGGTDYTLANAAISNTYYSMVKTPQGLPLDPAKWTVQVTDSSAQSQSSPTNGTWYNLGSLSISVPIGSWNVKYFATPGNITAGTDLASYLTLSTSNNSESDSDLTSYFEAKSTGNGTGGSTLSKEKAISVSSKTTYYLNAKTTNTATKLYIRGDYSKTIIKATSAYL